MKHTESQATRLFNCEINLHDADIIVPAHNAKPQDVADKFQSDLLPLLDPNKLKLSILAICDIILNDTTIDKDTMICRAFGITKQSLSEQNEFVAADFFSGVFLYAICCTKNKTGKNFVKGITDEYITAFESKRDTITLIERNDTQTDKDINAIYSKKSIWEASRQDYLASRSEGSRFANLNILSGLLPQGYVIHTDFTEYGKTGSGEVKPLENILAEYKNDNVSIIGEGGIGKTTFLLKLLEGTFEAEYAEDSPVTIFIELNRCPAQIGEWYSAKSQKTNFITRYIASQLASCEIEDAPNDVLSFVEAEFKKKGSRRKHEYLILLDGFNEVNRGAAVGKNGESVGSSIRELLNNEIKVLMKHSNVRIITTSRKMDMAYFSGMTRNIELTGVKTEDIEGHLRENSYSDMDIKSIKSSRKLMDCLRIPLFLCMFTASNTADGFRPVTRGEILYRFFNRSHGMYNERLNAERLNALSMLDRTQTLFILDFVLPYIGWTMEYTDYFGFGKNDLCQAIDEFFEGKDETVSLWNKSVIAFPEYETEAHSLNNIKSTLIKTGSGAVLDCIVNTLGIMYHDKRFKYYFIHHHVRDYFAGMYEIQLMRMAAAFRDEFLEISRETLISSAFDALSLMNENNWSETKQVFIGEIVSEHRNAPLMETAGKWVVPSAVCTEQLLLKSVLDVFRCAGKRVNCGIYNVIETIKKVRGNLAGEDFSGLDLTQCRLHETTCFVGRGENRLSANFKGAVIADDTFGVEGHYGDVIEFAYSKFGEVLFTISDDGTVKQWEVETGKCLNTVKVLDWKHFEDAEAADNFVISESEDYFLVRGYWRDDSKNDNEVYVCVPQEYSFSDGKRFIYGDDVKLRSIRSMSYSYDSNHIVVVSTPEVGINRLFLYERGKAAHIYSVRLDGDDSIIAAHMINDNEILLFSYDEKNFSEIDGDNSVVETECRIGLLNIKSDAVELFYSYNSEIDLEYGYLPIFCVNGTGDRIAFFEGNQIKEFHAGQRRITKSVIYKYDGLPLYMNYLSSDNDFVLIMYDDAAVLYSLKDGHDTAIYRQEDLGFQVHGRCCGDRLLLFDEMLDIYEWDLVKDTVLGKYRHNKMLVSGIRSNLAETEIVLSFDNDSAVIIDVYTGRLLDAIYYGERDSKIGRFLYDRDRNIIIMLLENEMYEYVKHYDIPSCSYKRTYFDFVDKQKIRGIETSKITERLLCSFDKKVSEITLDTLTQTDVYIASKGEQIIDAQYLTDGVSIQVVICKKPLDKHAEFGAPIIREFKNVGAGHYSKSAEYEPPYIPRDLMGYYIQGAFGTYGIEGNGSSSTLCINSGIFREWNDDLENSLAVDKRIWDDAGHENVMKAIPQMGELSYVCFDQALASEMKLLNISDDYKLAAVLKDKKISILKLNGNRYEENQTLSLMDKLIEDCSVDSESLLFCVSDGNIVFSIDLKTGAKKEYPSYIPGLIIIGCDFRGAKMSGDIRDILALHGGIM